jgi:hypothetical protein
MNLSHPEIVEELDQQDKMAVFIRSSESESESKMKCSEKGEARLSGTMAMASSSSESRMRAADSEYKKVRVGYCYGMERVLDDVVIWRGLLACACAYKVCTKC